MKSNNNIIKRSIISIIIFILFVILVFYFIFKENDLRKLYIILKSSQKIYLLLAFFCMACFSICEALNLKTTLKLLGDNVSFLNAYKYALSGFFVSSITPSSSGGDPMQLYLMTKDSIQVSHGVITLLVKLLVFQFVSILISLIGFLTSYNFFQASLGSIRYLIYLGMFLNFLVFSLYFSIIFCKPIITFLVKLLEKSLKKLHYKKREQLILKLSSQVEEYSKAVSFLKEHKLFFLKIILITAIQMLLYYSVPYFVYLSFGDASYSIFKFISIQSVLFISVSSLPFPGAVGISEAAFMHLYKKIYKPVILGSAMVITRFINFYIFILYSGLVLAIVLLKGNLKKKS